MITRIIPFALGIALISITACNNNGFKKTKDGLEYRIVKDEKGGKSPKDGDIVSIHIKVHVGDSVLMDSRKMNNNTPLDIPLMPALSSFKGDWPEGLKMLTPGDSAIFMVPVDSLKKINQGQLPKWMKSGDKITYDVVLVSVKSESEVNQEHQQKAAQQKEIDDKILQEYFTQNNLKPTKTASGLYYIIEKEGTGATPAPGQMVTVNYTGKTLDGKSFDSNVDPQFQHVQPFKFRAGGGEVIPGWDEGVMLLKKDSKAKLFLPSPLAYGPQSPGPGVSANSILMFDVEVTDIQNAPSQMPR
jgi:FKBP-type peptidyl-prolyl cis-trans isomerase